MDRLRNGICDPRRSRRRGELRRNPHAVLPTQEAGVDAQRSIADLDAPIGFIASNAVPNARFAKLMEPRAQNSQGIFSFERVPTRLALQDVFGTEVAGRVVTSLESI